MKHVIGAALVACLPALARAETQVPAIQANATASASATLPGPTDHPTQGASAPVPATMPPPIALVSPAVAPLNTKERAGVALSRRWANRSEMPHAGEDGYVRFLFGATLPTVVCAPLQVCNLALQPARSSTTSTSATACGGKSLRRSRARAERRQRTSSSSRRMRGSCHRSMSRRTGGPTP